MGNLRHLERHIMLKLCWVHKNKKYYDCFHFLTKMMKTVRQAIYEIKENTQRRLSGLRLSLLMYCKLIRKINRQGGCTSIIHNRLRYSFSVLNLIMNDSNR